MATALFESELKKKKQAVDAALQDFFKTANVNDYSPHGQDAWEMLVDFSSRPGKRIRGSLLLHTYEMCGGDKPEEAMKAAVAIELIQNYLLIIDDVMDRSEIRRGKPTLQHIYYDRLASEAGDDVQHIGDMLAINIGLLAVHIASGLLSGLDVEPERSIAAHKAFHANILKTGYGQIDDLYSGIKRPDEAGILLTHELKSSYYTFINPMEVGALLAGGSLDELGRIREYGVAAGIAFQLQDDILGLYGNEDVTGKSYLDDLKEGKYTLIIQQALMRSDKEDALTIQAALGNHSVSEDQAKEVRRIADECGAREYTEAKAREYADTARMAVQDGPWSAKSIQFLDELLDYIIERLK